MDFRMIEECGMNEIKTIDVAHIQFTSTVFPTDEDMKLWDSLSAEEQRAVVQRDLDQAEASGIAQAETMDQVMERVRAGSQS